MIGHIGVLAALAAMICWGIGDFLIQKATRKLGDIESIFFIGFLGSVALFPFIYNDLPNIFSNTNLLWTLIFLGFTMLIVSIVNFQSLKEGKIAIVEPILETELPITIFLAFIVLQEKLSLLQILLAALVFAGIILISVSKIKIKSKQILEKGAFLAVFAAFGFGFLNFFTGSIARITSPLLAIWSMWTLCFICCFAYLLYKKGLKKIIGDAKKSHKLILSVGFFDTATWVFFAVSMVNLPISLATAITESYPAIAVLLGIVVNKEVVKTHQFAGMSLALLASIALALTI